jgi:hypothetical protein
VSDKYISYGRCRSGKLWFWVAFEFVFKDTAPSSDPFGFGGPHEYGWVDTDQAARNAMREAVARLGGDRRRRPEYVGADVATECLKKINDAKRATKPPSGATDTRPVEYLYGEYWLDDNANHRHHIVEPFRITKKTPSRIYYVSHLDGLGNPDQIGYVDRKSLERDGSVYNKGEQLFLTPPVDNSHDSATKQNERFEALYREMIDAHPDRGGEHERFIKARRKYELAKGTLQRSA